MLAHGPRQSSLQLKPTLGVLERGSMGANRQELMAIMEDYARRRRIQQFVTAALILLLFVVYVAKDRTTFTYFGISAAIVSPILYGLMIAGAVYSGFNWRCPACRKYLGRDFNPRHCRNCGAKLHE